MDRDKMQPKSVSELKAQLFDNIQDQYIDEVSEKLGLLADPVNVNQVIQLPDDSLNLLLEYRIDCDKRSEALLDTQTIAKSELENRWSKVLKLAGAYAFVDSSRLCLC